MNKLLSFILVFTLISNHSAFAVSPSKQGTISATDVEGSTRIGQKHVVVINDGTNEVYIKFNTSTAATTSDFKLEAGEALGLDSTDQIDNIRYICAAAETASIRIISID